ncbi:pteridine reductase [Parahaliea mediterranea]|uniref:Pteridine reductase n=1 Tax=Parahaliea mediterranea TaxID=651086 RepID=A0A939DGE7_9GAMM|nr:pteridine reductase [Parahaliea mediterranea]MBN7797798.1 pteridine reductase [Parahaliea mediterranea]
MSAPLALVTGGAQRIGAAICRHLHQRGFDIALHYRRSEAPARQLADALNAARADSCTLWQADLEQAEDIGRLGKQFLHRHSTLDLLVNNASGFAPTPIAGATEAQFDALLGSNLKGPYFLIQALLPALQPARGSIVNLVDIHAERPLRHFSAYCAAKAGLAALTRNLAVELGPRVRVNGIAPGAILWPEDEEGYDTAARERILAATPLERLGDPQDIARTVAFFALEAHFVTGQVLAVDGGLSLSI